MGKNTIEKEKFNEKTAISVDGEIVLVHKDENFGKRKPEKTKKNK